MLAKYSGVESAKTVSRFRRKKKGNFCVVFSYFIKRACELRRERKRNVKKTGMHLQTCCFALLNYCFLPVFVVVAVVVA